VLRALLALKDAKVMRRALIVAPLRVAHNVWPKEAAEWEGSEWDRLKELKIRMLHGPRKDIEATLDADIFVINFDGLKWLLEDGSYKRFRAMGFDTLVWDESTALRHTRTKRFKLIKKILPTFARRWLLTGTPAPNGYMGLFGQTFCVDLGRALGQYITHYRMKYFTPLDRNGWNWALQPGADKLIQQAISPYVFQLDEKDYLELPELVDNIIRVDLPPGARKIYDEMENELIAELDKKHTVLAVSSGVAAMKCAQIAGGGIYHAQELGQKRTWTDLHTAKIDACQEIVGEMNERPVLIVYEFEHDLSRLRKAFPEFAVISGGVGAKASGEIIDAWNRDELPGILCQPQTISHGVNMQFSSCNTIVWHSLIWDYEIFDQLCRRLRRQGSKQKRIFNHLIVARATVDEAKLRALRKKDKTQRGFLDALKEYAQGRRKK
jgi:hypothetical protein